MSANVIQPSFAAGELSPTLYARVDLAKYHVGAALLDNFFVDYRGGASTRQGTTFIARTKFKTSKTIVRSFQFSTIQTYVLEFGDQYMRVFMDGGVVLEPTIALSGITKANPGVFTTGVAHGYSNNQTVFINSVLGMTQVNQVTGVIQNATGTTFTLNDLDGNAINTSAYTAYTSGGTVGRVFELATPYVAADLALLKLTQSADVMTIVHPSYAPRDLSRTSHYAWSLDVVSFAANIAAPANLTGTASAAGNASFAYVVTAVGTDGQESVASVRKDILNAIAIMTTAGSISLSWDVVALADHYNVYKANPSSAPAGQAVPAGANFGFMGSYTTAAAVDTNITPDFTVTPPLHTNPFASANNPGATSFFQQRKAYAASTSLPETFWLSKPGAYKNFDIANPVNSGDAITGTLSSKQVNNIKYMVAMPGGLIILTGGGAWQLSGGTANAAVTPASLVATPQAYNGCADVEPIPINQDILYVQQRGTIVRNLAYNLYANIYTGTDISLLSNHLFSGFSIVEWAYAEEPFKLIWTIRDDGSVLTLTYLKEQEIYGWAQSSTEGLFKSVTTLQEGNLNAVYFVVSRYINGQWLQMIERLASRAFTYGSEDAWCVDCGLQTVLTYPVAGLSASASTGTGVVFTADAAVFTSGDVGSALRIGGGIATITAFTDSTHLVGKLVRDITAVIPQTEIDDNVPLPALSGDWSLTAPVTTVTGLGHLEGKLVAILGDGNVFPSKVVTNGTVTLNHSASKITVGLAYTPKLKTLRLDVGEPTIQGKRKKLPAVTARVDATRGLKWGRTFNTLTEFKQRDSQLMGQPIELETGDQRLVMDPLWDTDGQICFQQDYPLPATILGVIPEIWVGDTK